MPSFTNQIADLTMKGPMVEIMVVPSNSLVLSLKEKNQPLPKPVKAVALVDTGATSTVITPPIIQALGIEPIGIVPISTPSTTKPVPAQQYIVGVHFPNNVVVQEVTAIEAPLGGQNIQCLIGRDILKHGVLIYTGYINQFTLSF